MKPEIKEKTEACLKQYKQTVIANNHEVIHTCINVLSNFPYYFNDLSFFYSEDKEKKLLGLINDAFKEKKLEPFFIKYIKLSKKLNVSFQDIMFVFKYESFKNTIYLSEMSFCKQKNEKEKIVYNMGNDFFKIVTINQANMVEPFIALHTKHPINGISVEGKVITLHDRKICHEIFAIDPTLLIDYFLKCTKKQEFIDLLALHHDKMITWNNKIFSQYQTHINDFILKNAKPLTKKLKI